jgi:hypothetical protein
METNTNAEERKGIESGKTEQVTKIVAERSTQAQG